MAELEEVLTKVLRSAGFRKSRRAWSRIRGDVTQLVNLQKSQFGPEHYVNVGINLNKLLAAPDTKVAQAHLQVRLAQVLPEDAAKQLNRLLAGDQRHSAHSVEEAWRNAVMPALEAFVARFEAEEQIVDFVRSRSWGRIGVFYTLQEYAFV